MIKKNLNNFDANTQLYDKISKFTKSGKIELNTKS